LVYPAFDKSYLQNLINNKIPESKILDYKRDKIGRKDTNKKEFLFDVSSFANIDGGNLILWVDEGENEEKEFIQHI
jgi:predicted HTH transcriptional regulator